MALVEIQGFDHQNNATDLISDVATANAPWVWSVLTLTGTVIGAGRVTGGKALYLGSTGVFGGLKSTAFAGDTAILGCAVRVLNTGNVLIGFWDSATQDPTTGTMQASIQLEGSSGIIRVYRGSTAGTLLHATAGNQFPRNTYFYFEVKLLVHASAGTASIQLRGTPYLSLTGLNTQAGATSRLDGIFLGGGGFARVDDLYIADTTTGPGANPFNDFQGTPTFRGGLRVFTRFPSANGVEIDFTPLSGTNTSQVQEHAMDSDTTYNWDVGTILDQDLFDADATPVAVTPLACKVQGSYREAGTGRLWNLVNKLRSGTTQFQGDPVTLFPAYTYQADIYPQNPDGNVSWDKTAVDASQIGYEIVSSTIIKPPPPSEMIVVASVGLSTAVDRLESATVDQTVTLVVPTSASIIIVHVVFNALSPGLSTLLSSNPITDSVGLVWARRFRVTGIDSAGRTKDSEVWWAAMPSPGTINITAHTDSPLAFFVMTAHAISGANTTTPWDINISLPTTATDFSGSISIPTVAGVSTDSANSMVLFFYDEFGVVGLLGGPAGFSRSAGGECINSFIGLIIEDSTWYDAISVVLTSQTLTAFPAVGVAPGVPNWIVTADALQAA